MSTSRAGFLSFFLVLLVGLTTGCPTDPNPEPEPEPEPETSSAFFRVPRTFAAGDGPDAVATADLNEDAFPELLVANALANTVTLWLSNNAGAYTRQTPLSTGGTEPRALTVRDVDGDGELDIAAINAASDDIALLFGLGGGTFAAAVNLALPTGAIPRDVAVLDANGDGAMDLATANSGLGSVSLLIAIPDGGFADPLNLLSEEGTRSLLAVDLNGDTRMDLVAVNRDSATLSVFLNEDGGLFGEPMTLPTGATPRQVLANDLDKDGHVDLVVSNPGSANFGVHMGSGGGNFDGVVFTAITSSPTRFTLADFTGDGNADIITVLFGGTTDTVSSGELLILEGNGRGRFNEGSRYHVGAGVVDVAAVDFNRDGTLDIMACNFVGDSMLLVESPEDGLFDAERRFPVGDRPRTVFAGDLDRDSHFDLVTANLNSNDVTVLIGDGDGGFDSITSIAAGGSVRALALGHMNSDNNLDIVVTNLRQSRVGILLGTGGGNFAAPVYFDVRGGDSPRSAEPRSVALGDLNKDGDLDIVTGNANRDSISILLSDGDGGFDPPMEHDAGNFPLDVQAADLNRDGNLDVVLINGVDLDGTGTPTSAIRVFPGKGDGTLNLEASVAYVAANAPVSLVVVDNDADGDLDLVTSHSVLDHVQIFSNRGNGTFGTGGLLSVGDQPNTVDAADLNGDGRMDLYTTNGDGSVTLRLRGSVVYNRAETVAIGSQPVAALAVDLDGDGLLDLAAPNLDTDDLSVVLGKED